MSAPARRLTPAQVEAEVSREVARINSTPHGRTPELEGKCRICRDPDSRRRVNIMLGHGMRPAEIVENLSDINDRRRKNAKIGYWSVFNHRKEHFRLQEHVKEAQLRVLERRAEEEGLALAEGVGSILTLRGYLEIIANKGFESLVNADSVGFTTGLDAQRELEVLMRSDRVEAERAAIRRDVALIQQAIIDTLPEDMMRAVSHRLDVLRGVISEDDEDEDTIEGEIVVEGDMGDADDDDEAYDVADFVMDADDDDELEQP
jgi:hypothetical protein